MVRTKKFILSQKFEGLPKESDFQLVEEVLPELKDGEILIEALYLSVDPYMRSYEVTPRTIMVGSQVGKVMKSKNKEVKEGRLVMGYFGWRTHTVIRLNVSPLDGFPAPYVLPDLKNLPASLALGVLGMPGNAAYFGFLEICKPRAGETVLVSGAAGAVGTAVGQIAKIKKCRVIGIAGTPTKVSWLIDDMGFDAAVNYKTKDLTGALKAAAPNGIDCYFDNVGGDISSAVLNHMNTRGRIAVCGCISSYNVDTNRPLLAPIIQTNMINKELVMEGFLVQRWTDRWMEGIQANLKWIREGKMKYHETVTRGFEKMPKAFIAMLRGDSAGKAVVKVKE